MALRGQAVDTGCAALRIPVRGEVIRPDRIQGDQDHVALSSFKRSFAPSEPQGEARAGAALQERPPREAAVIPLFHMLRHGQAMIACPGLKSISAWALCGGRGAGAGAR